MCPRAGPCPLLPAPAQLPDARITFPCGKSPCAPICPSTWTLPLKVAPASPPIPEIRTHFRFQNNLCPTVTLPAPKHTRPPGPYRGWRLQGCLSVFLGTEPSGAISGRGDSTPLGVTATPWSFLTAISAFQGKLDNLCDFVRSCDRVPLMWYQPRCRVSRGTGMFPRAGGPLLFALDSP